MDQPGERHPVLARVVAGVQLHRQLVLRGLLHRVPEQVVLQGLLLLGVNGLALGLLLEDLGDLLGRGRLVVDVPAVGVLRLDGHGVAAVLVEPPVDHPVPVGQLGDGDAGRLAERLEIGTGEHADDADVLHQERRHLRFLERATPAQLTWQDSILPSSQRICR